jgi:hypothetical protein
MEAGCKVRFNKFKCTIWYDNKIILEGGKDMSTDLWTLPIGSSGMTSHHDANVIPPAAPVIANAHVHFAKTQIAFFIHTVRSKANSIRFTHQSLCSPCILTLLKAICHGYLNGCPNLTVKGVTKYLNPSPASAKDHMKRPRHGIHSTQNTVPTATKLSTSHVIPPLKPTPDIDNNERDKYNFETKQNENVTVIPNSDTPHESNLVLLCSICGQENRHNI